MNNKEYRRVGDSPIIGAGTFANSTCAVSCTGAGENFIKEAVAHSVAVSCNDYLSGLAREKASRRESVACTPGCFESTARRSSWLRLIVLLLCALCTGDDAVVSEPLDPILSFPYRCPFYQDKL